MNSPIEPMDMRLNYPVFAVLSVEPSTGEKCLVYVEAEANDCLPLFRTRELAELYIEQARGVNLQAIFEVLLCSNGNELEKLLTRLPPSTDHVIWDSTLQPQYFKLVSVADLIEVLRQG